MIFQSERPLGVIYEHPRWFNPLFTELESRDIAFHRINPLYHSYDPTNAIKHYHFVYNDMSLSCYQNDHNRNITSRFEYVSFLEELGVEVINGSKATFIEHSKAKQVQLLASLKLLFPATRVVNHADQVLSMANRIQFPLVAKTNYGNRGRVKQYNSKDELEDDLIQGAFQFGSDNSALIQEFVPPGGGYIVRVETLGGKFHYALKVYVNEADLIERKYEAFIPSDEIIRMTEEIVRRANIEVGSVEYLTSQKNNKTYFFDINAHAKYGIEVRNVLGYDPYESLVNFLERRSLKVREIELAI